MLTHNSSEIGISQREVTKYGHFGLMYGFRRKNQTMYKG